MNWKWIFCIGALLALVSNVRAQDIPPGEVYGSQISPTHDETPPAATPYDGEKKGLFSAHDQRERVVNAPDKPVQLKKLKFGGDQSETSGAFKGSLLDKDIAEFTTQSAAEKQKSAPQPQPSAEARATETPAPKQKEAASPSPSPSPSVSPSASPRASASAQDRH